MPYRFFFSYARDNDPLLHKFYEDLCAEVKQKEFHKPDEVAFIDVKDILAGAPWKEDLEKALRTCRSFVSICSPAYINSEYCGKELHAFLKRYRPYCKANKLPSTPRLIQPIIWGAPGGSLNDVLLEFQHSDADYPPVYAKEGLRYMMQIGDHADDYRKFTIRLAHKLVDYSNEHPLPDAAFLDAIDSIASAFERTQMPGPSDNDGSNAWFIFVAGRPDELIDEARRTECDRYRNRGGRDWKPFMPDWRESVGILAQAAASEYELYYGELPLDRVPDCIEQAELRGELVIVLVDVWTLRIKKYRELMRKLDKNNFENCVILVPWNCPDPETDLHAPELEKAVRDTFKWKIPHKEYFHGSVYSRKVLRSRVSSIISTFTNRTTLKRPARNIANKQIREEAQAEGIPIDKAAIVAAPER